MKKILWYVVAVAVVCGYAWWSMGRDEAAKKEKKAATDLAWQWFHSLGQRNFSQVQDISDVPFDWNGHDRASDQTQLRRLMERDFTYSGAVLAAWSMPPGIMGLEYTYLPETNPENTKLAPPGALTIVISAAPKGLGGPTGPQGCLVFVRTGSQPKVVGFRDVSDAK
jgi:hypothetical protein